MLDPAQQAAHQCAEIILKIALAKDLGAFVRNREGNAEQQWLDLSFGEPDGTVYSWDEWQARRTVDQARAIATRGLSATAF